MDIAMSEGQAARCRMATTVAILTEYVGYARKRGMAQPEILEQVQTAAALACNRLYLPTEMAARMTAMAMNKGFGYSTAKDRVYRLAIENFATGPTKIDDSADDAGLGLPPEVAQPVKQVMEAMKVIDESGDVVVKTCLNDFIKEGVETLSAQLPPAFIQLLQL